MLNGTKDAKYDEVWAVDKERIDAFFAEHGGEAEVISLPERSIGMMTVPQTRVMIYGQNAEEIHRLFILAFLSAGG